MTSKIYFRFLLAAAMSIAVIGLQHVHAQQWVHVGQPGFSPSGAGASVYQRLIIDEHNTLYVAFSDEGQGLNNGMGTVMRYEGSTWVPIGTPGFTPGLSKHSSFALGRGDTIYYSFADGTSTGFSRGRVMRYDGNSWDFMGDVLTVSQCQHSNVVVQRDGTVYFGSVDVGAGGFVDGAMVVKRYNGNSWVTVGSTHPVSDTGKVTVGYLAIDRNDTLWAAYGVTNYNGTNHRIIVKKFDGTDWITVGSPFLAGATITPGPQPIIWGGDGMHLAFDHNNVPYIAYSANFMGPPNISVHRFDGTGWALVGPEHFTKTIPAPAMGTVVMASLAFDRSNNPYIAFSDQTQGYKPYVMKWNGTVWDSLAFGVPGFIGYAHYMSLAFDGNDNPYFAFYDAINGGMTSVMTYTVCEASELSTVTASSTDICLGDTVMLTVTGTLHDATGWEWYEGSCGGTVAGSGDTLYVSPTDTTTYYVRGMGACVVSGPCASVTVNVTDVPKPTFGADGDTLVSSAPEGNQWYLDGEPIPGATGQKHGMTKTGAYSVKVTVGPCSAESDPQDLIPTGISVSGTANQIRVFPVPFMHAIQVYIDGDAHNMDQWKLQVTDQVGRTVYAQNVLTRQNQINLSHLAQGVYVIHVHTGAGGSKVYKVVKQ